MTIDQAINRYSNNAEYERRNGSLDGCKEFRQLAEWLKELKWLREQTTWIPVSERLPEDGIPCICTVYNTDVYKDNIQVYDYYLMYDEDTEQWSDDNMDLCPYDVLAWMPLPPSYQGE